MGLCLVVGREGFVSRMKTVRSILDQADVDIDKAYSDLRIPRKTQSALTALTVTTATNMVTLPPISKSHTEFSKPSHVILNNIQPSTQPSHPIQPRHPKEELIELQNMIK